MTSANLPKQYSVLKRCVKATSYGLILLNDVTQLVFLE